MEINLDRNGEKLTIAIEGRLDTNTAPELDNAIKNDIADIKDLTLDLSGLEYVSSAGLRVILATQKIMNSQGKMVVTNVQDMVMEVFEATGFTDVLTIE
ncbi:MAG: STAS domain-containing protein [Methanobrevibacter woesei]|uniref:STAS domain-containing protein n=1 Tax=Methanobrevibacter woesei TaxID=190976 RepID=UPI0023EF9E25|nr:STAS domain-containing protein [Methanobrevibacter woesei]MCI7291006.1 STAS domain-containing protein [Methanobrevibacter woesei]